MRGCVYARKLVRAYDGWGRDHEQHLRLDASTSADIGVCSGVPGPGVLPCTTFAKVGFATTTLQISSKFVSMG